MRVEGFKGRFEGGYRPSLPAAISAVCVRVERGVIGDHRVRM